MKYNAAAIQEVIQEIAALYDSRQLSTARLDAKYGQCQFSKNFFANPEAAVIRMLGERHIANMDEMRELESYNEDYFFSAPVSFKDYLLEIVTSNF